MKHNKDEKAVKNDNAGIPIHFWNESLASKLGLCVLSNEQQKAVEVLHIAFTQRIWVWNVTNCFCGYIRCKPCHLSRLANKFKPGSNLAKSFSCSRGNQHNQNLIKSKVVTFLQGKFTWCTNGKHRYTKWYNVYHKKGNHKEALEIELDIPAGVDCITRASCCTPWNWTQGLRLFFWHWGEFSEVARDGAKTFIKSELPDYSKQQKAPRKKHNLNLVREKLKDVLGNGYIAKGEVMLVTSLFNVSKGNDDLRLVYDATKSGLNEACSAPWFSLQTCESHLCAVDLVERIL